MAVSAASLQAAYAPDLTTMEKAKPWSVSASLRGFYDDNYTTTSSHSSVPGLKPRDSFGFEVSPSASLNLPLDQTFIGLSYIYSLRWYEDRTSDKADHSHQFNGKLDHAFSERYKLELNESFALAQEPEILDPSGTLSSPLRVEGNNLRNTASGTFSAQLTQLLGLELGYGNTIYDYEQTQEDIISDPLLFPGNPFGLNSRSALLDRMEHQATANLRWQALRQTVGVLGYQFGWTAYTSDDPLQFGIKPSDRDNRSHKWYVGADHNFNAKLNGSVRVGGEYVEYFNDPSGRTSIGPYADASLTYSYLTGSYLQAGLKHEHVATDLFAPAGSSNFIQDQEATSVYASVVHKLTSRITGSLLAQYQHSSFDGADGNDNYFKAGLNLAYRINPFLLAETGYNYDRLASDFPDRSYTRNYVYVGIRATY